MLNYFFGKRITRLEDRWNRPPYQADALDTAHIVHFHGPKPWDLASAWGRELRINHFEALRRVWLEYLRPEERSAGGKLGVEQSRGQARTGPGVGSEVFDRTADKTARRAVFLLFGVHRSPKSSKAHWCGMAFGLPGRAGSLRKLAGPAA